MSNKTVQVGEARGGNTKVLLADIVDGLVVDLILDQYHMLEHIRNPNLP